jgi:hypothetical protein
LCRTYICPNMQFETTLTGHAEKDTMLLYIQIEYLVVQP